MPQHVAIAVLLAAGLASSSRAAEQFPYTAFINADEVNVRSGPGDNYYPVLKLDRGMKVEVYRHDPGGWYAVRPPEGSFSWVAAEFVRAGQGRQAVVSGDRVVARVGSVLSDVRDVIQVRLDRGEELEILEAKRFNSGPAAQTWYKISPPAGEFRWISGKYIDREPRVAVPRDPNPRNNMILARMQRKQSFAEDADAVGDGAQDALPDVDPRSADRRIADRRPTDRWVEPGEPQDRAADRRGDDDRLESDEPRASTDDDGIAPRRSPPAVTANRSQTADMATQLDEMDLELSSMVVGEPSTWDLRDLHGRAENALARGETAVEHGKARILLSKIARFEDIRQRYVAVMDVRGQVDRRNRELAARPSMQGRRPLSDDPRYDGVGKLAQVMTGKLGTPRYALLDETGEVRYYVTAAPGVNLRNYLGRQVGVSGTLGFLPEQQRQHVTARHIVPVEDTTLR